MTTESAATVPAASQKGSSGIVRGGLFAAAATMMALTLYLIFFWVPTDANLGVSQRILYFHVPVAMLGLLSIVVVAAASAAHLITRREVWDSLAYSAAEVGVLLTSLGIVTGAMWAKPTWGTWWTWDPKLTLTLVLWFIYVGYLMLRAYGPKGSQGARYGAVVALIGAIDAPIIYYAANLWRTTHPTLVVGPVAESGAMDSRMAAVLMVSIVTFVLLCAYVLVERYALRRSEAAADELYRRTA